MTCVINKENLEKVKEIEKLAYPTQFHFYQNVDSVEDANDHIDCDGDFFCHIGEDWYILGCNDPEEVEVHDLASAKRNLGFSELNIILNLLRSFGDKTISADCRDATSYKLLKLAEKRGSIKIMREMSYWDRDFKENMHQINFKVNPANFKEWLELCETLDAGTKSALEKINPRIFPDRQQLEKLIKQMEEEPGMISRKDAFDKINAASGNSSSKRTMDKFDSTIQKANSIKQPTPLLQSLQQDYLNRKLSNPELLSLTYMSFIGASDANVQDLARFIKDELSTSARKRITFPQGKPKLITKNGVTETPDFISFSTGLHALPSMEEAQGEKEEKSERALFDPKTDVRPERQEDLLIEKNGIYIYRGSNPMKCRLYGKNTTLCIASSSSTQMYFSYRHDHKQTQYFIFDTNKDEKDPARLVNPGVAPDGEYSEWVDFDNSPTQQSDGNGFKINGYRSIEDYKNYLTRSLGISMEQLDEILKPLPVTPEEEKLKKYLDDYKSAS
jgi:hypothetical protein